MKKIIYLISILLLGITLTSQAQFINYQGVARDNAGNILINQPIALRLSVLGESSVGTAVYVETHATTTDGYGLFTLQIGQGSVVTGVFNNIAWSSNSFFLKVEIDPTGGTNYGLAGTTQFAAVPYALNAKNGTPNGQNPGDMLYWNGTSWVNIPASATNGLSLIFCNGVPHWGPCLDFATLTTTAVTSITGYTAISGGNVTNNGGSTVTERGVCLATDINPNIYNITFTSGVGSGNFTTNLTGLNPNTSYYIRAYATNSSGTAYGNQLEFTTLPVPSVTTTPVTGITTTTASSGGNVESDGGTSVTSRGVCWSTSANPTITDTKTTDGSGTGTFSSSITGLTASTTYHVRAYATNSSGTAYGNDLSFITSAPPFICGSSTLTIYHIAGEVAPVNKILTYSTVTNIPGEPTKCWITKNLGADHQATIVNDASEAAAGWYWQFNRKQGYKHDGTTRTPATTWDATNDNLSATWEAAKDPCTLELGSGWRLPTSTEWYNVDASGGWTTWNGPYASGLKLHAAGLLNSTNGSLVARGSNGTYWSSTQVNASEAWYMAFISSYSVVGTNTKVNAWSARCLRD